MKSRWTKTAFLNRSRWLNCSEGGGGMQEQDDPIPLSALQHAVYCLRQAALIHIERQWEENRFTAEGRGPARRRP